MRLEEVKPGLYKAYWWNDHEVGDVFQDVDGYYKWWPAPSNGGFLDEGFLFDMANTLKGLNAEWDAIIQNDPSIGHREHDLE